LPPTKPWCRSPPDSTGTSEHELSLDTCENPGTSPTTSPIKQTNQKYKQPGVPQGVRDHTTSVHIEVERATSDHQIKKPTNRKWGEFAAHLKLAANDTSKRFELYLALLDGTLKELGPFLAKVNRTLERLEQRLAPVVPPTPFVADGLDTQPRDISMPQGHGPERVDWGVACEADKWSTRPTVNEQPNRPSATVTTISDPNIKQGTIIRYLSKKGKDGTITRGTHRESGAQPTPLGGRSAPLGPTHSPEMFQLLMDMVLRRSTGESPARPTDRLHRRR